MCLIIIIAVFARSNVHMHNICSTSKCLYARMYELYYCNAIIKHIKFTGSLAPSMH